MTRDSGTEEEVDSGVEPEQYLEKILRNSDLSD